MIIIMIIIIIIIIVIITTTIIRLVFGTKGGMGADCQNILRTLAYKLTSKNNEVYASVNSAVISYLKSCERFENSV